MFHARAFLKGKQKHLMASLNVLTEFHVSLLLLLLFLFLFYFILFAVFPVSPCFVVVVLFFFK